MKTQPKTHTPTPWAVVKRREVNGLTKVVSTVGGQFVVAFDVSPTDAAFIVKAVNSHEALLNRLIVAHGMLHELKESECSENCSFDKAIAQASEGKS